MAKRQPTILQYDSSQPSYFPSPSYSRSLCTARGTLPRLSTPNLPEAHLPEVSFFSVKLITF